MRERLLPVRIGCLLVLGAALLRSQPAPQLTPMEKSVVDLESGDARVWEHRLGPTTAVHVNTAEARALDFESELTFEIVVSADGSVESAKAIGDEKRHLDEGRAIEMARRFKPWTQDGKNTSVRVTDDVMILPPERWASAPRSFPEPWDLSGVKIELSRSMCYGRCPEYEVTILGDGQVHFNGGHYVQSSGKQHARIDPAAVKSLVRQFEEAKFFSAGDKYIASVTDNPTYTLTLVVGGEKKTVTDYVGEQVGMPLVITDLENAVDEAAVTERWIKGDE